MTKCHEAEGNEPAADGMTAHEVMLQETGECPWCGATEPKYNTSLDPISPDFDLNSWAN